MLTRIERPRVFRDYLVYDLEWIPGKFSKDGTMMIRLAGVYDGNRYRCYASIDGFIANELTSKNRGKWFYAHAGGLADFQFVLEALIGKGGFRVKASTSGSSLIIVHVSRGKHSWHFVDSLWLLKDKLANIGKWIGIDKGRQDLEGEALELWFKDAPISELRRYNEIDCIILFKAITLFEETLLELGGQLKMTQASCAMELFRRRFLRREIATSPLANLIARDAYFASRVEVINRHCKDAWYYDVNSSFPYAMTFPVPGDPLEHSIGTMPDRYDDPFIAFCDITVPEIPIPTVPTRLDGRLFFPFGKWSGWLTSVDLELLERTGGKIRRVQESITFEPRDDLKGYVETLYDIRCKSEGFMKISCKFLLNSIYGKFAESEIKNAIEINPPSPKGPDEGWTMLFPGCFMIERVVPIPHMHVPISAHVTAIGRRTLWDYMNCADEVHYCDTDGFSSSEMFQEEIGVLGGVKLEKTLDDGHYVTQKVYRQTGKDEKGLPFDIVRAKGFSKMMKKGKDGQEVADLERFYQIIEGEEVSYTRMARTRELLRQQRITPVERRYGKHLQDTLVPKRCFYPDGHSRPWNIDELRSVGFQTQTRKLKHEHE